MKVKSFVLEILSFRSSTTDFAWSDGSCCRRWSLLIWFYHYLKSDVIGVLRQILCHCHLCKHPRTQQVDSRLRWRISCDRRGQVMLVCLREDICPEAVTPDDKWRDTENARLDRANKHVIRPWSFPRHENLSSFSGEFLLIVSNSLTCVGYRHFHCVRFITYAVIRSNVERTVTRLKHFSRSQ